MAPPPPPPAPGPSSVICWDCDSPNSPDRIFCAECGTFIAVGTKVFSGGTSADGPMPLPAMPAMPGGSMSLGSYSVAMRRRAARRRVLMGAVSVTLVAVVGLASLYVATSPGDTDEPGPAALVAASTTPLATDVPGEEMGLTAGSLDFGEVVLEEAPDPATIEEPAVEPADPVVEPVDPATEPADLMTEPAEPATEPVAAPQADLVEPEPIVEPEALPLVDPGQPEPDPVPAQELDPEPEVVAPAQENSAVWRNGWVCDGELRLEDEHLRDWTITRASFLPGNGHERVILHLDRIGAGSGEVASLTGEAFPRLKVEDRVSGVRRPSLGRTAIALQFSDGLKTDLNLRGYRPSGLVAVREFSAYPAGSRGSKVIISTSTDDGCFKVRTPAWTGSAGAEKGQIYIDIKS